MSACFPRSTPAAASRDGAGPMSATRGATTDDLPRRRRRRGRRGSGKGGGDAAHRGPAPAMPGRAVPPMTSAARATLLALCHAGWGVINSVRRDLGDGDDRRVDAVAIESLRHVVAQIPRGPIPFDPTLPVHLPLVVQAARGLAAAVPPLTHPTPGRLRGAPRAAMAALVNALTADCA